MIEQLKEYLDNDINDLQTLLPEAGYDIAFGDTYALSEIRKAVCVDELPVYAKLSTGRTVLFVGENNQKQLVIQDKDGNMFNTSDKILNKAWTGEVVIVTDKSDPLLKGETRPMDNAEPGDMVLLNPMMNTWDKELDERRMDSLQPIRDVKYLDECYLPDHPVIVYFKKPTTKEEKDSVRSYTKGVEICIIDPTDPYTEFLHELGHVYWSSRLTDEEKESFKVLHSRLNKEELPPVLMDKWSYSSHEELFSTIYFWYLKGMQKNAGYIKILKITYNDAKVLIESIFDRVKVELQTKRDIELNNQRLMEEWAHNERAIAIHLNQVMGKGVRLNVSGQILKAKSMPHKDTFDTLIIPDQIDTTVLGEYKNRKWHHVNTGMLKGFMLVTDERDEVDFDFMKAKSKYNLVPVMTLIKSKDRSYQGVNYVRPEKLLKSIQDELIATSEAHSDAETSLMDMLLSKLHWGE